MKYFIFVLLVLFSTSALAQSSDTSHLVKESKEQEKKIKKLEKEVDQVLEGQKSVLAAIQKARTWLR